MVRNNLFSKLSKKRTDLIETKSDQPARRTVFYTLEIDFLHEKLGGNQHSGCRVSLLTVQLSYCTNILSYEMVCVKYISKKIKQVS